MLSIADPFETDAIVENHIGNALGVITRGSLERGIEMKLHPGVSVESIKAGTFVIIRGEAHDFFSMITDVTLDASNPDILLHPPEASEKLLLKVLQQTSIYTTVKLKPMLMLPRRADKPVGEGQIKSRDSEAQSLANTSLNNDSFASHRVLDHGLNGHANGNGKYKSQSPKTDDHLPVKTVPTHFSRVVRASDEDVERIFGRESERNSDWFNVGAPLDMKTTSVCIDLPKFVQRSNGIFGKSGTGKTFLTRTVLCGLIHHQPKVVNLIFDVHNEYGGTTTSEGGSVIGLRDLFGARRIKIYTLDAQSSRTRNLKPDEEVKISLDKIEPDDILSMQDELNLADAAAETAYQARNVFGTKWLSTLLELDGEGGEKEALGEDDTSSTRSSDESAQTLAQKMRAHEGSVSALQRKLKSRLIRNGKLLPFLTEKPTGRDILQTLLHDIESGTNIVLEFGGQQSMLAYLLVANVLTRRIHAEYVQKHERWVGGGQKEHERPNHLMITIEEAHKFLNPKAARQTIFGTIAREMRKYWVTLLVVDQRPSGIDDEVLSQIGTRISAQLNDEADIAAVLTGMSGATGLKGILAQLDSKQQALVMGHSVPMPVMIETRTYDAEMWKTFGYGAVVARDDF